MKMKIYTAVLTCLLLVSTILLQAADKSNEAKIRLTITLKNATDTDTLRLTINNPLFNSGKQNLAEFYATLECGKFTFDVDAGHATGYWSLLKNRTKKNKDGVGGDWFYLLDNFFFEGGDDIKISIANRETLIGINSVCDFSGKGSLKYTIQHKSDSLRIKGSSYGVIEIDNKGYYDPEQTGKTEALALLEMNKKAISNSAYHVLRTDIYYENAGSRMNAIISYVENILQSERLKMADLNDHISNYLINSPADSIGETLSWYYFMYLHRKYMLLNYLQNGSYNPSEVYHMILKNERGIVRDRTILTLFLNSPTPDDFQTILDELTTFMKDPIAIDALKSLEKVGPGKKIKNFALEKLDGTKLSLDSLIGKILVMDFWFNGCGGCARYFSTILKYVEPSFATDNDVVFLSISGDRNRERMLEGIESGLYCSAGSQKLYLEGKKMHHPIVDFFQITSFPFTVVIDQYGIIRALNSQELQSVKSFIRLIKELKKGPA